MPARESFHPGRRHWVGHKPPGPERGPTHPTVFTASRCGYTNHPPAGRKVLQRGDACPYGFPGPSVSPPWLSVGSSPTSRILVDANLRFL